MHTVYGQCPFGIAHTLWARPYARRQGCLPRTPPSRRVPGCGAGALECDDSNESALSASPHVGRPPEPGDGGDAVTQTSPPGDSRTDKCAREARAHCQVGLAGREASLSVAPCEKVAGLAFRNLYRSVRRCGLRARLSQQAPLGRAPQIRRCGNPKMRPTADWTNAFVKTLCPRRRQPPGPQP